MCYSAMVEENLRQLARWGETDEIRRNALEQLMRRDRNRLNDKPRDVPRWTKALESYFLESADPADRTIAEIVSGNRARRRTELERGLFSQRARLVKAERSLAARQTKTALQERRIAADKINWHQLQLANLERKEIRPVDRRIFPKWYTLVVANVDGVRSIVPMRYHCRQNGKPASIDKQYDGLYNARRDSLDGYWRNVWCRRHAVLLAWSFYENVALEDYEGRALQPGETSENLVLEFKPDVEVPMMLACVWDRWEKSGEDPLYSFAVITDDPPSEVRATGHDRCPIPLRRANLDAWLSPEGRSRQELQAILDDRERPYFEHQRLAA